MKKVYLLGFILAATVAQGALADTAGVPVGVPAPQAGCPKAFQGFHLGGNIGYDIGFAKYRFNDNFDAKRDDRAFKGIDGGVGVGYTHRIGCNWALGIAFDANWANTKGRSTSLDGRVNGNVRTANKIRLENSLDLYGRLGYVMREIAMPFIGLGWENARWKSAFTSDESNDSRKKKRLNSFLWKVGVDFLATKHVVVGFEYTGIYGGGLNHRNSEFQTRHKVRPQNNKFALTAKIVY
ncbi:MAG: porin family protein [Alphaproteobacteria bacterium]|nr:porin family protein [Alphaproteobacteria bacterium]